MWRVDIRSTLTLLLLLLPILVLLSNLMMLVFRQTIHTGYPFLMTISTGRFFNVNDNDIVNNKNDNVDNNNNSIILLYYNKDKLKFVD